MNSIKVIETIKVMCVDSETGVSGSKKAFNDLESRLSTLKGRKFYGLAWDQGQKYRACVKMEERDDPKALGLHVTEIPGGKYAIRKIENFMRRLQEIGPTFEAMAKENVVDESRPYVEFYCSNKELILMLPIK